MSDLQAPINLPLAHVGLGQYAHLFDGSPTAVALLRVIGEHKPIRIYQECGHSHDPNEQNVQEIDDIGLVCDDGLMYQICASCCDWNPLSGQTEHCISEHDHHHGGVHCMVVYSISESLGVSGEDRSEPTPAPRAPVEGDSVRLWLTPEQSVVGEYFIDEQNRECVTSTGSMWFLVVVDGMRRRVEVVTPEGTP